MCAWISLSVAGRVLRNETSLPIILKETEVAKQSNRWKM